MCVHPRTRVHSNVVCKSTPGGWGIQDERLKDLLWEVQGPAQEDRPSVQAENRCWYQRSPCQEPGVTQGNDQSAWPKCSCQGLEDTLRAKMRTREISKRTTVTLSEDQCSEEEKSWSFSEGNHHPVLPSWSPFLLFPRVMFPPHRWPYHPRRASVTHHTQEYLNQNSDLLSKAKLLSFTCSACFSPIMAKTWNGKGSILLPSPFLILLFYSQRFK